MIASLYQSASLFSGKQHLLGMISIALYGAGQNASLYEVTTRRILTPGRAGGISFHFLPSGFSGVLARHNAEAGSAVRSTNSNAVGQSDWGKRSGEGG